MKSTCSDLRIASLMMFALLVTDLALAAFGLCEITVTGGASDTISCGYYFTCTGSVVNTSQRKARQDSDESSCTESQIPASVVYSPKLVAALIGPCVWVDPLGPTISLHWDCAQDLSARTEVGTGTNC